MVGNAFPLISSFLLWEAKMEVYYSLHISTQFHARLQDLFFTSFSLVNCKLFEMLWVSRNPQLMTTCAAWHSVKKYENLTVAMTPN